MRSEDKSFTRVGRRRSGRRAVEEQKPEARIWNLECCAGGSRTANGQQSAGNIEGNGPAARQGVTTCIPSAFAAVACRLSNVKRTVAPNSSIAARCNLFSVRQCKFGTEVSC